MEISTEAFPDAYRSDEGDHRQTDLGDSETINEQRENTDPPLIVAEKFQDMLRFHQRLRLIDTDILASRL
jgi:hypothetical protein